MPSYHEIPGMPGIELSREHTRQHVTYIAIGGFFLINGLIILIGWMFLKLDADEVLKVLATASGVMGGVVGAIVGFYFRSEE